MNSNTDNQDLKWTIEAELENATFHLMDTDIYSLWKGEEYMEGLDKNSKKKRLFFTYEFYINSLSRKSLVELLERVREENTPKL